VGRVGRPPIRVIRGPRRIWIGGGWRTLVPLGALAGVYIGTRYYWPDGYVPIARPYCTGVTPEGCALRWQDVELDDGSTTVQCVQYCPRVGVEPPVPPPPVVTPQPVLPVPPLSCEMTVYPEPNLAGVSDDIAEDFADLGEVDWDNAIGSIEIKTGTWEFYEEPQFGGDAMRLGPGSYPDLGDKWTKTISSFQCIQ